MWLQVVRNTHILNCELLLIVCIDEYLDYHPGAVLAQCHAQYIDNIEAQLRKLIHGFIQRLKDSSNTKYYDINDFMDPRVQYMAVLEF